MLYFNQCNTVTPRHTSLHHVILLYLPQCITLPSNTCNNMLHCQCCPNPASTTQNCIILPSNTCNHVLHYYWTLHQPNSQLTPHNTPLSSQDDLPFSQPLRTNKEGLYSEEHQALPQGPGERWEPSGWEGRDWKIHTPRLGEGLVSTVISVSKLKTHSFDPQVSIAYSIKLVSILREKLSTRDPA